MDDRVPQTASEFQDKGNLLKTHNLQMLLEYTTLRDYVNTNLLKQWSDVRQWTPEQRYNPPGTKTVTDADEIIAATQKLLRVLL